MHVFIDRSRYCNLSSRSATYHLLRCALDYQQWSSDFEPSNWYLQLSRRVCHLHRVWWNGRRWQILFLVLCSLSCCDYHCSFFVAEIFGCSEEEISSSLFWIFFCVKHKEFSIQVNFWNKLRHRKPKSSSAGFGSSTSGLEVQRAIDCATRTFGWVSVIWKDWVVLEWTHFALAFLFRPHLFRPTESRLHIIFCPCGLWREDCVVQL